MRGKVIFFIFLIVLAALILPTFSVALRDLIEIYKFSFDKLSDNYLINTVKDIDTYKKFVSVVDPPNVLSWVIIVYILYIQLIGSFNILRINSTYKSKHTYGSHGTARWLTPKEIKETYYHAKPGWFIGTVKPDQSYKLGMKGAYHTIDNKAKLNAQINVCGPPGSNKTVGLVLSNIFHIPWSYKKKVLPDLLITDPKSELYCITSQYLENMGYDVKVLDFIHLKYGDSLNPIDFINDEKELIEIAKGYVKSVDASEGGTKKTGDSSFWDEQEAQVLGALIGYVQQRLPEHRRTFTEVAKILTSDHVGDVNNARAFFESSGITGAPLQLWKNFLMVTDSDRTRANILGGLAVKLSLFAINGIQNITNKSTVDISKIGAKKARPIALFVFMPDGDRTFSPIINVAVSTILNQLYKTAYEYKNKLYTPVYAIFEEMANIGFISGLKEKLGTMRSRRIYPMMIWQDLNQIKDIYKDSWETIVSKCDTQVYLGANDNFTADYISKTLGSTTINIQGTSRNVDGVFGVNKKSESNSYQQRPLLFPDECRNLDNSKLIFVQGHMQPSLLNKVQYIYWEEPQYRICEEVSVFDLPLIGDSSKSESFNIPSVNKVTTFDHTKLNNIDKAETHQEDPQTNNEALNFANDKVSFTVDSIGSGAADTAKFFDR